MNTTGIEVLRPLPREATKKGLEEKIKRKTRLRAIYFMKFRGQKIKYIQDSTLNMIGDPQLSI